MTWDERFLEGLLLLLKTLPPWAVPAILMAYWIYKGFVKWSEDRRMDTMLTTIPNILNRVNANVSDLTGRLDTLLDVIVRTRQRR